MLLRCCVSAVLLSWFMKLCYWLYVCGCATVLQVLLSVLLRDLCVLCVLLLCGCVMPLVY